MERLRALHFFVVLLLTGSAVGIEQLLSQLAVTFVNPVVDTAIIVIGAAGLYSFVLDLIVSVITGSSVLMKWYWGRQYLDGLWTYTSHDEQGNEFLGVWRIEQSLYGASVVAFGLDDQFRRRTRVRSVSDIEGNKGVYEVLNERMDWEYTKTSSYSKTTLIPDAPTKRFPFSYPIVMRGETEIFGGPRDGTVTQNVVFKKHEDVDTEDALIKKLARTDRPSTSEPPATDGE